MRSQLHLLKFDEIGNCPPDRSADFGLHGDEHLLGQVIDRFLKEAIDPLSGAVLEQKQSSERHGSSFLLLRVSPSNTQKADGVVIGHRKRPQ